MPFNQTYCNLFQNLFYFHKVYSCCPIEFGDYQGSHHNFQASQTIMNAHPFSLMKNPQGGGPRGRVCRYSEFACSTKTSKSEKINVEFWLIENFLAVLRNVTQPLGGSSMIIDDDNVFHWCKMNTLAWCKEIKIFHSTSSPTLNLVGITNEYNIWWLHWLDKAHTTSNVIM